MSELYDIILSQSTEIQKLKQELQACERERDLAQKERLALRQELEKSMKTLESELNTACKHVERYAIDLQNPRLKANPEEAARKYEMIHKMVLIRQNLKQSNDQKRSKEEELELLKWKHDAVVTRTLALDKNVSSSNLYYVGTKQMAKDVLTKRRQLPDITGYIRSSLSAYCDILGVGKEYEQAEHEYVMEWYSNALCNSTNEYDKIWRLEIGFKLGNVLASQTRHQEAEAYHRRVLNTRKQLTPRRFENEVESTKHLIISLKAQKKWISIDEALNEFWNSKVTNVDISPILGEANDLGRYWQINKKAAQAARVLIRAWDEGSPASDRYFLRLFTTAERLADAYSSLQKFAQAESMFNWICDELRKRGGKPPDGALSLEHYCYYTGVLRLKQNHLNEAKDVFKQTWDTHEKQILKVVRGAKTSIPNTSVHMPALECGHMYGETLVRLNIFNAKTETVTKEVLEAKTKLNDLDPLELLEVKYLHATVLLRLNKPSQAEPIFQEIFDENGRVLDSHQWRHESIRMPRPQVTRNILWRAENGAELSSSKSNLWPNSAPV